MHRSSATAVRRHALQRRHNTATPPAQETSQHLKTELIDFTDAQGAFKHKSTLQLIKAIAVFRLSTVSPLVNNADKLIRLSERTLGGYFTNDVVVKRTFFSHFCGGETVEDLGPFLEDLKSIGVGAILDYAAEADVPEEADADANDDRYHRSSAEVISARVYDYHGERECDYNMSTVLDCITHASHLEKEHAFCAIKITALCKPKVLEKMSQLLMSIRRSWVEGFAQLEVQNKEQLLERPPQEIRSIVSCPLTKHGVDLNGWQAGLKVICKDNPPTEEEGEAMFNLLKNEDGNVDYIDYTRKVTLNSLSVFFEGADAEDCPTEKVMRPLTHSGALPLLDAVESKLLDNTVKRINKIAALAVKEHVNVMIDAEQTYMQVAIDHFTTLLQRIYNRDHPRIYNTYQCYLTYSKMRILNDLERSRREGWTFAGKLVRGAYMVQERALAEELSYTSPIYATIEETHANFDECVDIILQQMPDKEPKLLIGSHNKASIEKTLATMQARGIHKVCELIFFFFYFGTSGHASRYTAHERVLCFKPTFFPPGVNHEMDVGCMGPTPRYSWSLYQGTLFTRGLCISSQLLSPPSIIFNAPLSTPTSFTAPGRCLLWPAPGHGRPAHLSVRTARVLCLQGMNHITPRVNPLLPRLFHKSPRDLLDAF